MLLTQLCGQVIFGVVVTDTWRLYKGWDTPAPHLLRLSSAVNISRHHNHWLAACYTKGCLGTCLRAHSGIAEGPAVPQCKSPPHIGSSFVVISSDTVRQVHLEISEKPGQKAFTFQDPESVILAYTSHSLHHLIHHLKQIPSPFHDLIIYFSKR